ncbi:hypothetical protein AAFF_G00386860 [Aldrovandia affinis]|uniref:Uncharacterized protein n=1 Tax=Aldrovandia affinis TaxID=143900 RepID=A0AAD7R6C5_9TELE|nr:hypothetical protein AAFF_G00386860 [Aldrovandia affinis]
MLSAQRARQASGEDQPFSPNKSSSFSCFPSGGCARRIACRRALRAAVRRGARNETRGGGGPRGNLVAPAFGPLQQALTETPCEETRLQAGDGVGDARLTQHPALGDEWQPEAQRCGVLLAHGHDRRMRLVTVAVLRSPPRPSHQCSGHETRRIPLCLYRLGEKKGRGRETGSHPAQSRAAQRREKSKSASAS